jgi:hypothetical protein
MRSFQKNKGVVESISETYLSDVIVTDQTEAIAIEVLITNASNLDAVLSVFESNKIDGSYTENTDSSYLVNKNDQIIYLYKPKTRYLKIKLEIYRGSCTLSLNLNSK